MKPQSKQLLISLVLLIGQLLATAASAEVIRVRGGEHHGFTRLVLDLPRPLEWSITRQMGKYRLDLVGIAATFDMSRTFSKITTMRVKDLRPVPDGAALELELGCDCEIADYLIGGRMLVVDIADPKEASLAKPTAGRRKERSGDLPLVLPLVQGAPARHAGSALSKRTESTERSSSPRQESVSQDTTGADQMDAIAEQLATTQRLGLLPVVDIASQNTVKTLPEFDKELQFFDSESRGRKIGAFNITIRNGATLERAPGRSLGDEIESECFPDEKVQAGTWGGEKPLLSQIGRLRSELLGEFDEVNPSKALQLARLYIHFGFGAEALLVLEEFPDLHAAHLVTMAEILEFGESKSPSAFAGMASCKNASALWELVSNPHLGGHVPPDKDVILRSINELPGVIRAVVAPLAGERLMAIGMKDVSEEIVRLSARGGAGAEPAVKLVDGILKEKNGNTVESTTIFSSLSETDSEEAPRALIELMRKKAKDGASVDYETAQLVDAMARERFDSINGVELAHASIVAFALSEAFPDAMHRLNDFQPIGTPELISDARSALFEALALNGGADLFLTAALDLDEDSISELSESALISVSTRVLDLGFPEEAVDILDRGSLDGRYPGQQLVRARAALELEQPGLAEAVLLNVAGSDAERLRARAKEMNRDYASARRIYEKVGDIEKAKAIAALADAQSSNIARVGDKTETDTNLVPNGRLEGATLGGLRDALEKSEETRRQVSQFVDEY